MMELVDKIKKIYIENPERIKNFQTMIYSYDGSIKTYLETVNKNPPRDLSVKELDNYSEKICFQRLLGGLPAKSIYDNFGEEVLKWVNININSGFYERKRDLQKETAEIFGNNNLEKARMVLWRKHFSDDSELILKMYDLMDEIQNNFTKEYDLKKSIIRNSKVGIELSEKTVNKYSLSFFETQKDYPIGWAEGFGFISPEKLEGWSIYLDSPASIGLMCKGNPSAVTSFLIPDKNTILINQIQGTNKKKFKKSLKKSEEYELDKICSNRGLFPINYRDVLIEVGEELGRKMNFSRVGILGSENNPWIKEKYKDGHTHLSLKGAVKNYDVPAEKLGYTKSEDGNWYKQLD